MSHIPITKLSIAKPIVLVGIMGAGKTTAGRRLAQALSLPFVDSDREVEKAAGCSIADLFSFYGERSFREGECRVITRLMQEQTQVIATGGGAFVFDETREAVKEMGISIWLRASLDELVSRTHRLHHRPLLQNADKKEVFEGLMNQRYDRYAEADIVVDTVPHDVKKTTEKILTALKDFLKSAPKKKGA